MTIATLRGNPRHPHHRCAEKDPWFVVERSQALVGLLLTFRGDIKLLKERTRDDGVDLWAEVQTGDSPSGRIFVVQVKGTASSDRKQWTASVKHLFGNGKSPIYLPACLFLINVRDRSAFYAWLSEPRIEHEQAKLQFNQSPAFRDLNTGAIDDIVGRVNAWYDVLPSALLPTSA